MTLVYTVAAVAYGLTSILIGFSLDICGLWFTRFLGRYIHCYKILSSSLDADMTERTSSAEIGMEGNECRK
jgi:hypothetical protein